MLVFWTYHFIIVKQTLYLRNSSAMSQFMSCFLFYICLKNSNSNKISMHTHSRHFQSHSICTPIYRQYIFGRATSSTASSCVNETFIREYFEPRGKYKWILKSCYGYSLSHREYLHQTHIAGNADCIYLGLNWFKKKKIKPCSFRACSYDLPVKLNIIPSVESDISRQHHKIIQPFQNVMHKSVSY